MSSQFPLTWILFDVFHIFLVATVFLTFCAITTFIGFLTPSHYKLFHYYALHAFYFYSWTYLNHFSDLSSKLSGSSIWSALLITNKFLISSTTSSLTKFSEPILTEIFNIFVIHAWSWPTINSSGFNKKKLSFTARSKHFLTFLTSVKALINISWLLIPQVSYTVLDYHYAFHLRCFFKFLNASREMFLTILIYASSSYVCYTLLYSPNFYHI